MKIPFRTVGASQSTGAVNTAPKRSVDTLVEGRPPIVDVLGDQGVAKVYATPREGGRVLWFNWALAESMGLEIPADRRMSAEFEAKLLGTLNLEVVANEDVADHPGELRAGYSEYYGGPGLGYNQGAGRAAFFGDLNLNAKGIGQIEAMLSDATSYSHRHGGMSMVEGGLEAIWGEVNQNLFSRGSTRILAVLDRGDHIVWAEGEGERRAVAYRAGAQTRPGHLLSEKNRGHELDIIVRMLEQSGDLVKRNKKIDLGASFTGLVKAHSQVAAEQFRHRMLHGALSPSNLQLDGAMLDLGTETPQPRTAPIYVVEHGKRNQNYWFETEGKRRIEHLRELYRKIGPAAQANPKKFKAPSLDFDALHTRAYHEACQSVLLGAVGLAPELARALKKSHKPQVARFAELLVEISKEKNAGVELNADKEVVEASVVDIFGALAQLPRRVLIKGEEPRKAMLQALAVQGGTEAQREKLQGSVRELAGLYSALLEAAQDAYAGPKESFEVAVIQRAEFENRPMSWAFRANLRWTLIEMVDAYEKTGDAEAFRQGIDRVISHSVRNVEAIREMGTTHTFDGPDGKATLTQARRIRGVDYGVLLQQDKSPEVIVSVPIQRRGEDVVLPTLDGVALSEAQLQDLTFKYTVDEWETHDVAQVRIVEDQIQFSLPSFHSQTARLEGLFQTRNSELFVKDRSANFEGYVFSVPEPKA